MAILPDMNEIFRTKGTHKNKYGYIADMNERFKTKGTPIYVRLQLLLYSNLATHLSYLNIIS